MFQLMDIEPSRIAAALVDAPIVSRLALASANERVRASAARRLGEFVAHSLAKSETAFDPRQMSFLEEESHG